MYYAVIQNKVIIINLNKNKQYLDFYNSLKKTMIVIWPFQTVFSIFRPLQQSKHSIDTSVLV